MKGLVSMKQFTNEELIDQLRQLYGAGYDYLFGSRRSEQFKTSGYFGLDPLDLDEYEKERRKEWRKTGSRKQFDKWLAVNENEDYIYIPEELSILEFDMSDIFEFIDYDARFMFNKEEVPDAW